MARGSAIAFDYPAKHIVEGDASVVNRMAAMSVRLVGEPWTFGISTEALAKEKLAEFLGQNGLKLANYEPIGEVEYGHIPDGGLVVAVHQ